ncbi:protein of unknown function [Chryseobacterium sp. JV274]|nr:protein of unknown function [Chryseobacterium sp. JV274]
MPEFFNLDFGFTLPSNIQAINKFFFRKITFFIRFRISRTGKKE